jgi:chromosomal replication initiation ATPase DnaA
MNFNLLTYVEQTDRVSLIPKADVPYCWTFRDQEEVESGEYLKTKDSIKRIVVEIAKEKNLITRSRKRELVDRRKYLFHVLRDKAHVSLSEIGRIFKKDHATVLHGLKSYDQIKDFPDYQENVREIRSFLKEVEPLKTPIR